MSIQKVEMFTVICDNCKKSADEDTDYSCWNDENYAKDVAMEADYITEGENHYCPKCYRYNDEDELVINLERIKRKCFCNLLQTLVRDIPRITNQLKIIKWKNNK